MSIDVAIVMGSASDWDVMSNAQKMLDQFGVKAESRVLSAHRTPKELEEFIRECEDQKVKAFIAGAGLSAALPGVVAALTTTPVIGVPLNAGSLDGMDALMSIVQMPPGIPVGTVAIGKPGAINAALYAVAMMAVNDDDLSEKLKTSFNSKFISTELSIALDLAISKASILLSIAVILALEFFAIDTAIQPDPVPISSTEIKSCNKIY